MNMLAHVADLCLCAIVSLHSYVTAPLCQGPYVLQPYVLRPYFRFRLNLHLQSLRVQSRHSQGYFECFCQSTRSQKHFYELI